MSTAAFWKTLAKSILVFVSVARMASLIFRRCSRPAPESDETAGCQANFQESVESEQEQHQLCFDLEMAGQLIGNLLTFKSLMAGYSRKHVSELGPWLRDVSREPAASKQIGLATVLEQISSLETVFIFPSN